MNAGTEKLTDRDNDEEPDHQESRARALPDHWPVHACTRIVSQHFRLTPRAMDFQTDRKTRVLTTECRRTRSARLNLVHRRQGVNARSAVLTEGSHWGGKFSNWRLETYSLRQ